MVKKKLLDLAERILEVFSFISVIPFLGFGLSCLFLAWLSTLHSAITVGREHEEDHMGFLEPNIGQLHANILPNI